MHPIDKPDQPPTLSHPINTSCHHHRLTHLTNTAIPPSPLLRLCSDWLEARATRDAPPGAPANWGCPRGHKCPFAHGEAELEGDGKEALEQVTNKSIKLTTTTEEQEQHRLTSTLDINHP